jgi:alpha-tubulin suppressor-like RCC1 family protein
MTARVHYAAVASLLCVACSHELVVLERRVEDAGEHARDAAADNSDGALADAAMKRDAGADDADVAMPPAPDAALGADLASGFAHTCALVQGSLYCWGADDYGQVGVPGELDQTRPLKVNDGTFTDVCTGERHSCALRADGTTLCWGANAYGELGLRDTSSRETPTPLDTQRFVALSCGGFNSCALTAEGELWCWGDNSEGKLGQGDPPPGELGTLASSATPIPVLGDLRFTQVEVGQGHVCAISKQGRLYCWGRNTRGQLGVAALVDQARAPTLVAGDAQYTSIAAGQFHSCAVDVASKLWCWGQAANGLLGVLAETPTLRVPTALAGDGFESVSVNWLHSCALKKDGTLFCWGRGEEGQLGGGDSSQRDMPTQVGRDGRWRSVSAGQFHTCAFADDGLYCWGANDTGQLGLSDNARRYVPFKVALPP